jgi:PAS domain S-box-containing protein
MDANTATVNRQAAVIEHLRAENRRLLHKIKGLEKLSGKADELRRRLRQREDLLSAVIQAVPVMIIICDPGADNFVINREFTNLTGWTDHDLAKRELLELCFPDPGYRREIRQFLTTKGVGWRDLQCAAKNGSVMDAAWGHFQLEDHRQVVVGIDIGPRKKADADREEAQNYLQIERNKIRTIISSIPDEVWHCAAADRRTEILNPTSLTALGFDETECRGMEGAPPPPLEIFNPDGTPRPLEDTPLLRSLRGEVCKGTELARHRKTGESLLRQYHSSPVRDRRGVIIGAVCVVTDITERKKLEEALERNNADLAAANMDLESFTHSISHDLRNSLNIIVGMCGVLDQFYLPKLDADGRKCIMEIQGAVEKMARVIDGLLRLSRITRQDLSLKRVSISDISRSVAAELCPDEKNGSAEVSIEPDLYAVADGDLVTIVLSNLIGNALKFSGHKKNPRLKIGSTVIGNKKTFYVRDNGLGFGPEDAERVFLPFTRLHKAMGFEGHGLGLAIVDRIIRRHGGRIWAVGESGKGATFYFTLPNR